MIYIIEDICFLIQNLIFLDNSDNNIPTISLIELSCYYCNKKLWFFNGNLN